MKFKAKKYYTFDELAARWECGLNDLVQAVIGGELIPSVHINGKYSLSLFTADHNADGWLQLESVSHGDSLATSGRTGFHYLIWPRRTGVAVCQFSHFSENATGHDEGDICYELTSPIDMANVLENGVFMPAEVARVESTIDDKSAVPANEKLLSTKERNTLLIVIAGLCKDAGYDYAKAAKTAGMIQSTVHSMNVSIGETTIEGYLKKIPDALAARMK